MTSFSQSGHYSCATIDHVSIYYCFAFFSDFLSVLCFAGQASSSTASQAGVLAEAIADLGWSIASKTFKQVIALKDL